MSANTALKSKGTIQQGDYTYAFKQVEGWRWPILVRWVSTESKREEEVLNLNVEFPSQPALLEFDILRIRKDNKALLFSLKGRSRSTLFTKELPQGSLIPHAIPNERDLHDAQWSGASLNFYFSTIENTRSAVLFFVTPSETKQILALSDPRESLTIHSSNDGESLITLIRGGKKYSSEIYREGRAITPLSVKRTESSQLEVDGDTIFLLSRLPTSTNLLSVFVREKKQEPIVPSLGGFIERFEVVQHYVVLYLKVNFKDALEFVDLKTGEHTVIPLENLMGDVPFSLTRIPQIDPRSPFIRFKLSSLINADREFTYDLNARHLSEIDPHKEKLIFTSARVFLPSRDGTLIPMTLAYQKEVSRPMKFILHGYGAYGTSVPLRRSPQVVQLLKRGIGYAVCHARGGGEGGPPWHDAGRGTKKEQSIEDFAACANYLVDHGYALSLGVFAEVRSAGALLPVMAASRDSALFAGIILDMPFLDPPCTKSSSELRPDDFEEWGDPSRSDLEICKYAPINNLPTHFPRVLVRLAENDRNVSNAPTIRWLEHLKSIGNSAKVMVSSSATHEGELFWEDERKWLVEKMIFVLTKE